MTRIHTIAFRLIITSVLRSCFAGDTGANSVGRSQEDARDQID
jgi:hypothetical protein